MLRNRSLSAWLSFLYPSAIFAGMETAALEIVNKVQSALPLETGVSLYKLVKQKNVPFAKL